MNILSIFGRGVRLANKSTRICLYLWVANLVFSALILAPFTLHWQEICHVR